jgi:hypothetical protein
MEGKDEVDARIAAHQPTYLAELRALYDIPYEIDAASALNCAALSDADKVLAYDGVSLAALRTLGSGGHSLASVLGDATYGALFRDKVRRVVIKYDADLDLDSSSSSSGGSGACALVQYEEEEMTMSVVWLRAGFGYSYTSLDQPIRNMLGTQVKLAPFYEQLLPPARAALDAIFSSTTSYTTSHPGRGMKMGLDGRSLQRATDLEAAVLGFCGYQGYYSTQAVVRACYALACTEPQSVVELLATHIRKVVFALQPGSDPALRGWTYEAKKGGRLVLQYVLDAPQRSGMMTEDDIQSALLLSALGRACSVSVEGNATHPNPSTAALCVRLLEAAGSVWGVRRRGDLSMLVTHVLQHPHLMTHVWAPPPLPEELKWIEARVASSGGEMVIKCYGPVTKANHKGDKEKRRIVVTTRHVISCELTSKAVKESNWKPLDLHALVALDLYPVAPQSQAYALSMWFRQAASKANSSSNGTPESPTTPQNPTPSQSQEEGLPIPEPSFEEGPSSFVPVRRTPESRPLRRHPSTAWLKATQYELVITPDPASGQGNLMLEEMAWVVAAAWSGASRRPMRDCAPFYLLEKRMFEAEEAVLERDRFSNPISF